MERPVTATFYDHILDISRQEGCSVPEALTEAKKLGISALEVSCGNLQGRAEETAGELAAAGMAVTTVPSYFHFDSDGDVSAQAADIFADAKTVGARTLLVIPGFIPPGADREECTQRIIERTGELAELADKAGFSLVMEDFDNENAPFSTSAQLLRFMDAVPGLRACFDTGNFRFAGEDAMKAYDNLRGRIGHVHLKDRSSNTDFGRDTRVALDGSPLHPSPVGAGEIPIGELLSRLREDGYSGPYTIEHYGAEPMLECLKRSVNWLEGRFILQ